MISLPEDILARFRTLSLERIGRVEAAWLSFVQGLEDPEMARGMAHDLHNVKGDARIAGFNEIALLCQKLEDLLEVAARLRYDVPEDFELVVTMAIQFLGLLLRKRDGGAMRGFDLDGFVRQVDEVLHGARSAPAAQRTVPGVRVRTSVEASVDRISEPTRQRLAVAATAAFLEYLRARGPGPRGRLRSLWLMLREEVVRSQSVALVPLLERHLGGVHELAEQLGKSVTVDLSACEIRTDSRVAEAIDLAVLHVVRNAVDHGIEAPAARRAAGKPAAGTIQIRARESAGMLEVLVEDDGAGVDLAAVRERAVQRALLSDADASGASSEQLLELLFHPGFTTRTAVTEVSGRGVGLDAAKAALVRIGGVVRIEARPGGGTVIALRAPARTRQVAAYQFLAPGGHIALAVSAGWTPSTEGPSSDAIDPLQAVELAGCAPQTGVTAPGELLDLALRLRWGFLEVSLRAATEPVLVTAERICPTPDDHAVEVVSVEGRELLLVRPEHFAQIRRRLNRRTDLQDPPA